MRSNIVPGGIFPDYELPDHTGKLRKLSELQGEDPLILTLARGHYCPKGARTAFGTRRVLPEDRSGVHSDRHDRHRRSPYSAGIPRVSRSRVDLPFGSQPNGSERISTSRSRNAVQLSS
jgi:hypothetical protein